MNKRVLLPTDFSENAKQAIDFAVRLHADESCDFYILNAFTPGSNSLMNLLKMKPIDSFKEAKAKSEKGLVDVLDSLMFNDDSDKKHHFKTISINNDTIDAIKEVVDDKDIDLIIMGTKGETASKEIAYGSSAVYVMEKVRNCPVIVVPEKALVKMPKEIVFPTGYKLNFKRRELKHLIEIAKKSDAEIAVLHIEEDQLSTQQLENKKLLEDILGNTNYKFYKLPHHYIESALNIFVESRESDMIAFINRKHAFFGSIITRPLVKGITFHSRVPILVMHDITN